MNNVAYIKSLIGRHGFIESDDYSTVNSLLVYKVFNAYEDEDEELVLEIERKSSSPNIKFERKISERFFIFLD